MSTAESPQSGWEDVDARAASGAIRVPLRGRNGQPRAWALVDAADAARVLAHRWHLDSHGYAIAHMRMGPKRRTALMHRFILDAPSGLSVDHRNRCKLDNRRSNLRLVTHAENMMNVGANRSSTSRYRGVSWNERRGVWVASFRGQHLGSFRSEHAAARCAAAARGRVNSDAECETSRNNDTT